MTYASSSDPTRPSAPLNSHPTALFWSRLDWFTLLCLALLVLLFHWPLLTPKLVDRQSYPPGDFSGQFWAFSTFEVSQLQAGQLPLWNPYTYAGSPFWADVQSAVFYPFSLMTILFASLTQTELSLFALELEAILHFFLAGLFMYLFARRVTQNRAAGFTAALVFTFSGYLTGYPSQQLALLEVVVWLPLILYFTDRSFCHRCVNQSAYYYAKPHWPSIRWAGLAWGLAILAGHPQSWLIIAYTLVAYYSFLALQKQSGKGKKENKKMDEGGNIFFDLFLTCLPLLILLLIGLGLSAVQLLPAIEYMRLSGRASGVYDEMSGGFPIVDLIQIILPGVISFYSPLYVGIAGLLLALGAVLYQRSRETIFWAIWGGLALLMSFGGNTFLYAFLYLFGPGFSIFRGQERWALVVAFSLAILAGYGTLGLLTRPEKLRTSLSLLTKRFLFGAVGMCFLFFYGLNETGWTADNQFYTLLNRAVFLTMLLLGFFVLLHIAREPNIINSNLLYLVICSDLFTINWQTNLFDELPQWHTQTPTLIEATQADWQQIDVEQAIRDKNVFRVYNEFRIYDNYGIPYSLQDLWGASPLKLSRYAEFLGPPMLIERAWAMLNVHYVITWRSELYVPSTVIYQETAADGTTYVHRLDSPSPRAWLVYQVEQMPEADILPRLAEPAFDLTRIAALSSDVSLPQLGPETTGSVSVLTYQPNRMTLEVETKHPALLVLSEIDYPGWQAQVDDVSMPILRANWIVRAVFIPAGRHEVVLRFVPWTFWGGALVSVITVLVLIGLYLSSIKQATSRRYN